MRRTAVGRLVTRVNYRELEKQSSQSAMVMALGVAQARVKAKKAQRGPGIARLSLTMKEE
jgi:hypothetical protein